MPAAVGEKQMLTSPEDFGPGRSLVTHARTAVRMCSTSADDNAFSTDFGRRMIIDPRTGFDAITPRATAASILSVLNSASRVAAECAYDELAGLPSSGRCAVATQRPCGWPLRAARQ